MAATSKVWRATCCTQSEELCQVATLGRATAAWLRGSPALCGARPQLPQLLARYVIATQTHKEVQQ